MGVGSGVTAPDAEGEGCAGSVGADAVGSAVEVDVGG